MIDKQPDKLRAIMLTHKQAVDYIYAHPKEAADLAAKRMVGVDKAVVEQAVAHLAKVKYWSDGGFNPAAMDALQKVLAAHRRNQGAGRFQGHDRRALPARGRRSSQVSDGDTGSPAAGASAAACRGHCLRGRIGDRLPGRLGPADDSDPAVGHGARHGARLERSAPCSAISA